MSDFAFAFVVAFAAGFVTAFVTTYVLNRFFPLPRHWTRN